MERFFLELENKEINLRNNMKKPPSKVAQTLLFHSPAQTTAHRPELIFHIMKSRDQTSVLLSVKKTQAIQRCEQNSVQVDCRFFQEFSSYCESNYCNSWLQLLTFFTMYLGTLTKATYSGAHSSWHELVLAGNEGINIKI